jgi:hypothetical protein
MSGLDIGAQASGSTGTVDSTCIRDKGEPGDGSEPSFFLFTNNNSVAEAAY